MNKLKHIYCTARLAFVLLGTCIPISVSADNDGKTVEAYTARIKEQYEAQNWTALKQQLDEALELYPDESELNRWAATYFLQQKETDNARYFLIKATRLNPENTRAKLQLVTLEEELGNLSSAVCYVNELLEQRPYDRALWKRKIGLYRKKGEHEEADRLLKRLRYIYPNDTLLARDYVNRLEENYMRQRKSGHRDTAIRSLEELIGYRKAPSYYLDLCNLLLQEGRTEEAVAVLSDGIEALPQEPSLVQKKAEILSGQGNGMDAYYLLRSYGRGDSLRILENRILLESARRENWNDPYLLYGRVYASQKSEEALEYLLNTSFSRGYEEDALYYIAEAEKRYGKTPALLYRKYRIQKRLGDSREALRTLELLAEADPGNTDIVTELVLARMQEADSRMGLGQYDEALPYLESAHRLPCDADLQQAVSNKLIDCYARAGQHEKVLLLVDSLRAEKAAPLLYTAQKAVALDATGRTDEALSELERQAISDDDLYETIATRHIQRLMEAGAVRDAGNASERWLRHQPASNAALRYAVQTSGALKRYDDEAAYIGKGRTLYPDDLYFILKEAAVAYRNRDYQQGLELVTPYLDSLSGNAELRNAYAAHAEGRAEQLLKEKRTEEALAVLEKALDTDTVSQSLAYTAGTAYEQAGDYRTAYRWYTRYNPAAVQVSDHKRKLMAVQRKLHQNRITAELLAGWYAGGEAGNSIQTISYTRMGKKNVFEGRLDFTTRTGEVLGAAGNILPTDETGFQAKGAWGHTFSPRWSSRVELAAANRFFPAWSGQVGLSHYFPADVELGASLGYRHQYDAGSYLGDTVSGAFTDMYSLKLSGSLYRDVWRLTANCDTYLLNSHLYFNVNSQIRFYPLNDGETHLLATVGAGTAPESDFIDKMMPGSFDRLNLTLGVGGVYLLSKNLSAGLMASCYRFYAQRMEVTGQPASVSYHYKNLYNLYAQLVLSF